MHAAKGGVQCAQAGGLSCAHLVTNKSQQLGVAEQAPVQTALSSGQAAEVTLAHQQLAAHAAHLGFAWAAVCAHLDAPLKERSI